jgi:NADPH-dependent 2,4-dienoyl-CoA reductase/sulfur reductase-like enzyme
MKPKRTPSRRERIAAALRQAYLRFESDRQTKSFVLRLFPAALRLRPSLTSGQSAAGMAIIWATGATLKWDKQPMDRSNPTTRNPHYDVAIIGAGFGGTMVAVHLARSAVPEVKVALIERSGRYGSGVAYGTVPRGIS